MYNYLVLDFANPFKVINLVWYVLRSFYISLCTGSIKRVSRSIPVGPQLYILTCGP